MDAHATLYAYGNFIWLTPNVYNYVCVTTLTLSHVESQILRYFYSYS